MFNFSFELPPGSLSTKGGQRHSFLRRDVIRENFKYCEFYSANGAKQLP